MIGILIKKVKEIFVSLLYIYKLVFYKKPIQKNSLDINLIAITLLGRRTFFEGVNAILSLKTSGFKNPILFVNHGDLSKWQLTLLQNILRIQSHQNFNSSDLLWFHGNSNMEHFYANNVYAKKLIIPLSINGCSVLYFDSDVIFFRNPIELIGSGESNIISKDIGESFFPGVSDAAKDIDYSIQLNAGFWYMHSNSISESRELIMKLIAKPIFQNNSEHLFFEQTLTASMFLTSNSVYLEESIVLFDTTTKAWWNPAVKDIIVKHFPGKFKPLIFRFHLKNIFKI